MRCDRLAKDQPAEITMFQISEVQESPAFNGRRSFLTLRERRQLLAEWPTLESRERGEAFRRLFKTVKLHWDRQFIPARTTPSHPRKTDRPGRYRYTLRRDLTEWDFTTTDSGGSW
jgi:hypothetical protein